MPSCFGMGKKGKQREKVLDMRLLLSCEEVSAAMLEEQGPRPPLDVQMGQKRRGEGRFLVLLPPSLCQDKPSTRNLRKCLGTALIQTFRTLLEGRSVKQEV